MFNLFGKNKEGNEITKEHQEIVRYNINEPLIAGLQTLLDHSNYVNLESERFLELYHFTQSSEQCTGTPVCPRTQQYLAKRGLNDSILLAPSGVLSKLDVAVQHGLKMNKHIQNTEIQSNITAGLDSAMTGAELSQSSVDTVTQMLDTKKHTRKAGYKGRLESVRVRKQDINQRVQTAIDKLDDFHKVRLYAQCSTILTVFIQCT